MTAYYNEIEPYAAAWLRNLISAGLIAPGDVDERSIADVVPDDLRGYTQCHFFAGIGVWSHALRLAGWPDDRPVWTGSCPCQPFSAAGAGAGFDDERHLWPAWYHLIGSRRPSVVFGEQVASPNGYLWLDLVQADLEGAAYTCGPVVLPAAGFGAPHGRHRIFYVADAESGGQREQRRAVEPRRERHVDGGLPASVLADAAGSGSGAGLCDQGSAGQRRDEPANNGGAGRLGHTAGSRSPAGLPAPGHRQEGFAGIADHGSHQRGWQSPSPEPVADAASGQLSESIGRPQGRDGTGPARKNDPDAAVTGFWFGADWIYCRDERWRPVEPGTFPLVDGASFNVGSGGTFEGKSRQKMLRGYGNAILPQVAAQFIGAYMTTRRMPMVTSQNQNIEAN